MRTVVINMEKHSSAITTQELWARLFQTPSVGDFLSESDRAEKLPRFHEYLSALARSRGERPEPVIRRADIDNSYGHRLFKGGRNPSRDTVLQLSFGLGLGTDETQQLLKVARMAPLHPRVKRDAVIAWCLHYRKSLVETQQILSDCGLPLLGGKENGA